MNNFKSVDRLNLRVHVLSALFLLLCAVLLSIAVAPALSYAAEESEGMYSTNSSTDIYALL